jgi:hypothetical protein
MVCGILLALLLVLLCFPVKVWLRYEQRKLTVTLQYLFIRRVLYEKSGDKEELAAEAAVGAIEKDSEKSGGALQLEQLMQLLRALRDATGFLVPRFRIRDAQIRLVAKGEQPEKVGILAGTYWALLGNAIAMIGLIWKDVEYTELSVIPDFTGEYAGREKISCKVQAVLFIILIAGWRVFRHFLRLKKIRAQENTTAEEKETAHEPSYQ